MAIDIKSPGGYDKGKSPFADPGGITNGEPGYQKRTPSSKGVPEVTYDKANPADMSIKSPTDSMPKRP